VIKPALQDDAFIADVKQAGVENSAKSDFDLWWLGQSGYLTRWHDKHILIDPYLSDSLTKKYENSDKPHVRMTERVVAPEKLDFIDIVTSSHNHTDHLDAETLIPILANRPATPRLPMLLIPNANRTFVSERLKIPSDRITGIDADGTVEFGDPAQGGIEIRAVPAAHNEIERDENGQCRYLGYIISFGRWSIYHSGDTLWHDDIVQALLRWNTHRKIDVAILPINGHEAERRVAGNLNGREAARLGRLIGAGMVIPCHYDMFEFNTAKPGEFIDEARNIGQPYQLLRCGERFNSRRIYLSGDTAPVLNPILAQYYTGKHILVGLTYKDKNGKVTEQIQFQGHIARINQQEGIIIYRRDTGNEFALPPDLAGLRPAPPGEYRLRSTGEVVKDPQVLTSWTFDHRSESGNS
jgi:L-ascorbate metabolism protein UlaG (beta-lactamase superfamily)